MDEKTNFTHNDYEIVQRDVVYQGVYRMAKYLIRHKLFNGGMSPPLSREVMERRSAVAVLPYDPVTDQVILIEQFRIGAIANPQSPWLLEIVAGVFNPNEDPSTVGIREAKEEADCEILDLYPICEYFVSPGGCNEYINLYIGRIDAPKVCGIFGLAEENEDIRTLCLKSDEAYRLFQQGQIKTAPAAVSLLWLQLNREWLRQLWQTK